MELINELVEEIKYDKNINIDLILLACEKVLMTNTN
jgi:hypothetical protein